MTADDIFLHTFEVVGLAGDGSFVEHLGGFLEGGCRHERLGLEGSTRDTLQDLGRGGGNGIANDNGLEVAALELRDFIAELARSDNHTLLHRFGVAGIDHDFLAPDTVVFFGKVVLVDDLLFEETGVAGFVDLHLAHHLTNDDFEVLVVDLHTLEAIDVLNLIDDVFLNGGGTLDGEDVAGGDGTIGKRRSGTNKVVLLHKDLLGEGHKILLDFAELGGNHDFAVAALDSAHRDFAIDFGNNSGVGRVARLEEFGDTRQTTGDVACRTHHARNLGDDVARFEALSVFDGDVAVDGEVVGAEGLSVFVDDVGSGHEAALLRFDDDAFTQTGGFVFLYAVGDTFLDIFKDDATGRLGDDDSIEGIPFGNERSLFDVLALVDEELRTVRNILRGEDDAGVVVDEAHFGQT